VAWAPDSAIACAAVPVSAIAAAAPMARQPNARLMRIAISRSCSPDRYVAVMPVTDQIANVACHERMSKPRMSFFNWFSSLLPPG
jgi:hypothetical protein